MTARDRAIVLCLVALLAVLTVAIGAPAFLPAELARPVRARTRARARPASPGPIVGYREGILGQPGVDRPADRQHPGRPRPRRPRLQRARQARPGRHRSCRTWRAAGRSTPRGTQYVFTIRADARWQDGEPVTSADVSYTIAALKDPDYTGPGASSWREVTLTVDRRADRQLRPGHAGRRLPVRGDPAAPARPPARRRGAARRSPRTRSTTRPSAPVRSSS